MDASVEAVSYYQVLGVPRDASPEEVRRAYRRLAQAFHPDKQQEQSEELRAVSKGAFAEVQQAYEVLSGPQRQIYDVYGRVGLEAGMEVGPHLSDLKDLRREWEAFQAKAAAARIEAEAAPQSHVQIKVWAVDTVRDLWEGRFPPRAPKMASATMSSSVQMSPSDKHVLSLGGA